MTKLLNIISGEFITFFPANDIKTTANSTLNIEASYLYRRYTEMFSLKRKDALNKILLYVADIEHIPKAYLELVF